MTPEARILELAEKATPGPWVAHGGVIETARQGFVAEAVSGYDGLEAIERANAAYIASLSPSTVKAMCLALGAARVLVENGTNQHRCDVRCDEWTGDQNWTPCVGERFRDALAVLDAEGESK